MSRALMQSTQLRVTFSIQMEFDSPASDELVRILFWSLAWLAMRFLQVRSWAKRVRYETVMFWQDVSKAAGFTFKVFIIVFNSWAWALGVRL